MEGDEAEADREEESRAEVTPGWSYTDTEVGAAMEGALEVESKAAPAACPFCSGVDPSVGDALPFFFRAGCCCWTGCLPAAEGELALPFIAAVLALRPACTPCACACPGSCCCCCCWLCCAT